MRMNFYSALCDKCGLVVEAREGFWEKDSNGKSIVFHKEGQCGPIAGATTVVEQKLDIDPELIASLIEKAVKEQVQQKVQATKFEIKFRDKPNVEIDQAHKVFPDVMFSIDAGVNIMLVGPAGSGKTHLAQQVAKALSLNFYMANRVASSIEVTGYCDISRIYQSTQFREAYEHGGVFLLDEMDASDAEALNSLNAGLAGDFMVFPDGKLVHKHADFVCLCACNTFGRGADKFYTGRNPIDAATLDRFAVFEVEYDEQLEFIIASNDDWTRYVQSVRHAIAEEKVYHIVSPRASINGAKLLAAGMERSKVEDAVVWKGLDPAQRSRVEARVHR